MPNTALNRTTVLLLVNKSGGSVSQGDVVIVDAANAGAFTTTTTSGYVNGMIGVVLNPRDVAADEVGIIALAGYVPKITLESSATIGQMIKTHSVAKQGTPHAAPMQEGDFAQALAAGTSPAAVVTNGLGGGGGVTDAEFVTAAAHADLTNEVTIPGLAGSIFKKPDSPSAYDEEFDSNTLDAKWTVASSGSVSYDFDTTQKSHWINRYSGNGEASIRQTFQPGASAFSITYHAAAQLRGDYQGCILYAYDADESDGIMVGFQWAGGLLWTMAKKVGGGWTWSISQMSALANMPVFIHLKRDAGSNWELFGSNDGTAWTKVGATQAIAFTVDHVILQMTNGGQTYLGRHGCDFIRFNWLSIP